MGTVGICSEKYGLVITIENLVLYHSSGFLFKKHSFPQFVFLFFYFHSFSFSYLLVLVFQTKHTNKISGFQLAPLSFLWNQWIKKYVFVTGGLNSDKFIYLERIIHKYVSKVPVLRMILKYLKTVFLY